VSVANFIETCLEFFGDKASGRAIGTVCLIVIDVRHRDKKRVILAVCGTVGLLTRLTCIGMAAREL
jgi:hypothetical protein